MCVPASHARRLACLSERRRGGLGVCLGFLRRASYYVCSFLPIICVTLRLRSPLRQRRQGQPEAGPQLQHEESGRVPVVRMLAGSRGVAPVRIGSRASRTQLSGGRRREQAYSVSQRGELPHRCATWWGNSAKCATELDTPLRNVGSCWNLAMVLVCCRAFVDAAL